MLLGILVLQVVSFKIVELVIVKTVEVDQLAFVVDAKVEVGDGPISLVKNKDEYAILSCVK